MIIFQNNNLHSLHKIDDLESTVSTLLIPEKLMEDFLIKKKEHKDNLSIYLRKLLRRYRTLTFSGMIPEPNKVKTEYQEEKQNLVRISFRPNNSDWVELGELALVYGKSRCWMFVYLLKLDILNLWSILVQAGLKKLVPTLHSLELKGFWIIQKVTRNFARGYHVKV